MHRPISIRLLAVAAFAALATGACQQQDPGTPAPSPEQTAQPPAVTAQEPAEQTEDPAVQTQEESAATQGPAVTEAPGQGSAGPTEESTAVAADVTPPEGLPTEIVEAEPAWSVTGRLVGTVGDVAAFQQEGPDGESVLVGIREDGTQAWERELHRYHELAEGGQAQAYAVRGLDSFVVAWAGPLVEGADVGAGVHVTVLEPGTGQDRASGFTEVEGAVTVSEAASLDELFVQTQAGATIVRVDTTTGELTPRDPLDPVWGDRPVVPVTSALGMLVDGRDYTLQLVDADLEPVGEVAQCAWPQGPAQPYLDAVSANGTYAAAPGSVVDLGTGRIECLSRTPDRYIQAHALADDGGALGVAETPSGPAGAVHVSGQVVTADEDATARAVGILGDVVIFEAEDGYTAHRLLTHG